MKVTFQTQKLNINSINKDFNSFPSFGQYYQMKPTVQPKKQKGLFAGLCEVISDVADSFIDSMNITSNFGYKTGLVGRDTSAYFDTNVGLPLVPEYTYTGATVAGMTGDTVLKTNLGTHSYSLLLDNGDGTTYAIGYMWGTTGILYNPAYNADITSCISVYLFFFDSN